MSVRLPPCIAIVLRSAASPTPLLPVERLAPPLRRRPRLVSRWHPSAWLLLTSVASVANAWPFAWAGDAFRGSGTAGSWSPSRRLEEDDEACNPVAVRLMPPPALKAFETCVDGKMAADTTHDWSVPGAEVSAHIDCWCRHNMTSTIEDFHCCSHRDIYPMCTIDCNASCTSELARTCKRDCPSMCLEAAEYLVDANLCANCNFEKCWPVMQCLTEHAAARVEAGSLTRTCHEVDFTASEELKKYMTCWHNIPKHSSHWSILSSVAHCICREDMVRVTNETSCCESIVYGGGACDVECLTESDCNTQEAQTCIFSCKEMCTALSITPPRECITHCLGQGSKCRKYASCRPPSYTGYICGDNRHPNGASGCCEDKNTGYWGCPKLCETQRVWRLDRNQGTPWWARWHQGPGVVGQCTCEGCPTSTDERAATLRTSVEDHIWTNGQMMLVDVARREGLLLGPNVRMQALMAERNKEILKVLDHEGSEIKIDRINAEYGVRITEAARTFPDDGDGTRGRRRRGGRGRDFGNRRNVLLTILLIAVPIMLVVFCGVSMWYLYIRHKKTSIENFSSNNPEVVMGNPVNGDIIPEANGVRMGAPVTVQAPQKAASRE